MATKPLPGTLASLNYTPPTLRTFTGTVPTAPTLGTFTAPDEATFARSPGSQYLQSEAQKAIQRGAAAKGTLLTGGLQKRLQENAIGLAAQDYGNAYTRARDTYTTNRDTSNQNFANAMTGYSGSLAGFNAQTAADLGYGRLGLEAATAAADRETPPEPFDPFAQQKQQLMSLGLEGRIADARRLAGGTMGPSPQPQPSMGGAGLSGSLNQRYAAQDAMAQDEMKQQVADDFARQVALAREQYLAQQRMPMGKPLNQVRPLGRPGMAR